MLCADLRWLCHVREELPLVRACIQRTGETPLHTELLKLPTFRFEFNFKLPRSNCCLHTAFDNGDPGTENFQWTSGGIVLKHPCLACHVINPL